MTEKPDLFLFDQQVREEGFLAVCGVDEAGRGPLAGSVVAAAVILPPKEELLEKCPLLAELNDSKKLQKRREKPCLNQSSNMHWRTELEKQVHRKLMSTIFCRLPFWQWDARWKT